jgi:hypothetical protein
MDKVAGILEVDRSDDSDQIVISHPRFSPDADGVYRIKLLPRHARHLANLLMEYASYAEAEAMGCNLLTRPYPRRNQVGGSRK